MVSVVLLVIALLSYGFFSASKYFKDNINKVGFNEFSDENQKLKADNIFYNTGYYVCFNIAILLLPILLNLIWLNYDSYNVTAEFNGSLSNEVSMFETFSVWGWVFYSAYLLFFIVYIIIKIAEYLNSIKLKKGDF